MSNNKQNKNNLPFKNEIKQMKAEFKNMIDTMSDDEFLSLISFLTITSEEFEDEEWLLDEEWENEAKEFYNQRNKKNKSNNPNLVDDNLPF